MSPNPGIETEFDLAFSPTSYSETSQSANFRAGNNFPVLCWSGRDPTDRKKG